jgi:hypothetical protein
VAFILLEDCEEEKTFFPEIEGIDINPVKVLEKGAIAVDARIALANTQQA